MSTSKILVFAGSLRQGSFNQQLAALAAKRLQALGAAVTHLDLNEYPLPIYHGDIEANEGIPAEALGLHEQFSSHGGIFIASPEYNAGLSPLLVNVLAWVSRVKAQGGQAAAFATPVFAIGGASPGNLGGYRGLMALRQTLELGLSARVLPAMVTVSGAQGAFDESGELRDSRSSDALGRLAASLVAAAARD